ncbi:MFS transporter [Streptomyces mangrovisoli]|uniref:MFS transporter n=1 Tax=Streptomyces mangrovisoli TaxID=1428628 RepID=A0A1J4NWF7_9ACTN|nr:MFS transporter [Streptomyces mangrovisoli]OIJ65494.1 MFS transporter [Streptomyces mangrovisoli]
MAVKAGRTHYTVTYSVLVVAVGAYALLQSMVAPVLPTIQAHLHSSESATAWLMTSYLLAASVATPILGRVGDVVGKERMLVVTLLGLATGSLLAGLSHSIGMMIVARVVQGTGGAVLPLSFGIVRDEFPSAKVSGAVGVIASLTAAGGGLGLVLAGPIVSHLDYHWLFWFPMIATAAAAAATLVFVPASPVRGAGGVSRPGGLLLAAWLVTLLLAVSEGQSWGWDSAGVLGLLAATVVLVPLWILTELRAAHPLIDMRMMRAPAVWTVNLSALLFGVVMYTCTTFMPQLLQTRRSVAGYGFSADVTASGLYMLPLSAAAFAGNVLAGRIGGRLGYRGLLVAGSLLSVPPFVLLAVAHTESWQVCTAVTVAGTGLGLAFSAMAGLVIEAVPAGQTGVASGMNANIRTIGGAIGSGIGASLLAATVTTAHPLPADTGYTRLFWFLAGAAALATLAATLVPRSRRAPAPGAAVPDPVGALPDRGSGHADNSGTAPRAADL